CNGAQSAVGTRHPFADRALRAEVGYARHTPQGRGPVEVLIELRAAGQDALGVLGEHVAAGCLEHRHRVVAAGPRLRCDGTEKVDRGWIPRPTQVIDELLEHVCEVVSTLARAAERTVGRHTRLAEFCSVRHVRFRVSRGHPHDNSTVRSTRGHTSGCVHDWRARLRLALWNGSEEVVDTAFGYGAPRPPSTHRRPRPPALS